jgi:class 3 adenylate cyclase/tetratricopeptide (TPR) repeat protein
MVTGPMTATTTEEPPEGPVATDPSTTLKPYVPRLVVEWLRSYPDELHREIDATLVFVDISGFTALTERLARKGKVGAELMRDTLDGVFTALLDEAYEWGAGLLKWGGDALLLLFDGPDHARRGARAAWEMQRTIDRVGRLHLSGGTITLRMSVGIGTGRYHFFLTGSIHRELLIAGPAMTETLAMEAIADAGEIGISPALAAVLPAACIGPQKDGITLLGAAPDVVSERAPDVGDISGLDIASCIPIAARRHVLLKKSEPEHRTITAAFIDLMDTDTLLERLGPAGLGRELDDRIRSIQEIAYNHSVPFYETDVGKSSVKALLTAGAPSSTGHDEERMLRALREIMDRPGIVPMRIGVNTGKVFTGDFGPSYRRAYRVFGDAINTAARVMSKADAGQILSTEIVLDRSQTLFATEPITPFPAKGKAELVRASVVGRIVRRRDAHQGGTALLGRGEELGLIDQQIDRARAGNGSIIEISGGPGMGKSRLVEEAIRRHPDFRAITARCEEYEASTPYFPFRSIIRTVLGEEPSADADDVVERLRTALDRLDPSLAPWLPLLGILLGVEVEATPETAALDPRFLRDRLTEVSLRFLVASLSGTPTIFVIEDVQHLDEASQDLLVRLSRAAANARQVLLVTREGGGLAFPSDDDGTEAMLIELLPLSRAQTVAILELATEGEPLRPHEVEALADRSGGNPLFLFQLLETVRATGTIESLPDSIESLIAGEIDHLAPEDRRALRYASVFGTTFDPELLATCVRDEIDLDPEIWSRLSEQLILDPNGELRFRNTLIRDAAYEGLPYRRRRALHDRIGETLERSMGDDIGEQVGVLSLHYHEGQRWDKAWRFSREAGDRAMAVFANVEAGRFFERALAAGRRQRSVTPAELAAVYERTGDARYRLGEFTAANHAFGAARRLLDKDIARTTPLVVKQAMVATRTGAYRRALIQTTRALGRLEQQRGREAAANRARLMVPIAAVKYFQNRRVESIAWCQRAIAEARRGHARDALAEAYKLLDLAYLENGQIEQARYSRLALAIYEELGDLRNQALVLNNTGLLAQEAAQWDEARSLFEQALALSEQIGDRGMGALMQYNMSEILIDQGRYDEAEPLIRGAIRLWRASGADGDVAEGQRELARLLARRGELATARPLLEEARAFQVRTGKPGEVLRTDAWLAELLLLAGETDEAMAVLERANALLASTDGGVVMRPTLARLRGWGLLQLGRLEEAGDSLEEALQASKRRSDVREEALTLDAMLTLVRLVAHAPAELEQARHDRFEQLGIVEPPHFPTNAVGARP